MKPKAWQAREQWGIAMQGGNRERPSLIGEGWLGGSAAVSMAQVHPHGPTRPLMFTTRRPAREFCAAQHEKYRQYSPGRVCQSWRFRPVRVRESWVVL
jgi:hypothetical protein